MRWGILILILAALAWPATANPRSKARLDPYRHDDAGPGCSGHLQPGAKALVNWLRATTGHDRFVQRPGEPPPGYRCDPNLIGEHNEGRAIDWKLDMDQPADKHEGSVIKDLLLKNDNELARRMGVQTILWRCRAWSSRHPHNRARVLDACRKTDPRRNSKGWRHTNHMHLALNWDGAKLRTSYWRGR
jgi:hypothetical protein